MQTKTSSFIQSIKFSISERLCGWAHQENDRLRAKVERQERDLVALNERLMGKKADQVYLAEEADYNADLTINEKHLII